MEERIHLFLVAVTIVFAGIVTLFYLATCDTHIFEFKFIATESDVALLYLDH